MEGLRTIGTRIKLLPLEDDGDRVEMLPHNAARAGFDAVCTRVIGGPAFAGEVRRRPELHESAAQNLTVISFQPAVPRGIACLRDDRHVAKRATRVVIRMLDSSGRLRLEVEYNRTGLAREAAGQCVRLAGLRTLARDLGADLEIQSTPHAARGRVAIPIHE